jgi:hypothetical protein
VNGILLEGNIVRGFPTVNFALRVDTGNVTDITLLSYREGGTIYADVIEAFDAGLDFARKHLGPPKYEAFALPIGVGISQGLFDWVASSWGPNPETRDGAVLGADAYFNIQSEAAFSRALIVETQIPALDAASNQAGYFTVRCQPEFIGVKPGGGRLYLHQTVNRLWRTSNFRLQIPGLDCTRVNKIDAFSVTRRLKTVPSGSGGVTLVPDKVEFPNLKITLSRATAQTWFDWHQSFVVNGNNDDTFERNGTISFLTYGAGLDTELSRIELRNLGIIRLAPEPSDSAQEIPRVTAELYCEQMLLVWMLSTGVSP